MTRDDHIGYVHTQVLAKIGAFLLKKKFSQLNEQYFTQYNKKALLDGSASYHFIVLQLVKPV